MVVNTGDNRWATSNFIVAPTLAEGASYTTIAAALTAASSGNTIFIKPGTYTENLTLKAGVNLTAFECDSSFEGTGHVIISGTCTLTAAGTVTISGIQLQTNSAALLAVTGSAASVVNLNNCYLNCTNNTGITFSSSSASALLFIENCKGNLTTTGIGLFAHSSAGVMTISYSRFENSGGSTTASTISAGQIQGRHWSIASPITSSGTGGFQSSFITIATQDQNVTSLTIGGSGTNGVHFGRIRSGTATAISISTSCNVDTCEILSSNAAAIAGAGTLTYGALTFTSSSSAMTTTTQVANEFRPGITRSAHQPAILVTLSGNVTNATGDATAYTVAYDTEIFDQGSNFATNTFTAPVTGRYQISATFAVSNLGAGHTAGNFIFTTSNRTTSSNVNPIATSNGGNLRLQGALLMDMDAADTLTGTITISGSTKTVTVGTPNFLSCILSC